MLLLHRYPGNNDRRITKQVQVQVWVIQTLKPETVVLLTKRGRTTRVRSPSEFHNPPAPAPRNLVDVGISTLGDVAACAREAVEGVGLAGEDHLQGAATSPFAVRAVIGFLAAAHSSALRCSCRFSASSSSCIWRRTARAAAACCSSHYATPLLSPPLRVWQLWRLAAPHEGVTLRQGTLQSLC